MIGSIKGFVTLVKEKKTAVITTHCFIHREVLCSQTVGEDLKSVLDVSVSMINFVKQPHLKTRMFAKLCENMHKNHVTPSTHRCKIAKKRNDLNKGIRTAGGTPDLLQR